MTMTETVVESSNKPINPKIGIIYPPPEVRNIVDKTANFVARNGPDFESRIRQNEINNPKFNFLNPSDPYHAYYQQKVKDFTEGKATESLGMKVFPPSSARLAQDAPKIIKETFIPKDPPPEFEFVHDPVSINAQDIDIVKLTAQFVSRNGKQFLVNLMNRETRNYQFDFLRTQHNMFSYFTKLVEQYTKVLIPPRDLIASLDEELNNPKSILDRVKYRVEWHKYQERQRRKEEEAQEKERLAYAQIDWHDFVVVETVDFQPNETGTFPMPITPEEVGARAIADERGDMLSQQNEMPNNAPPPPGSYDALPPELNNMEDEEENLDEDQHTKGIGVPAAPFVDQDAIQDDEAGGEDMELSDDEGTSNPIPPPPPPPQQPFKVSRPLPPTADQVLIRHDYDPKAAAAVREAAEAQKNQVLFVSPFTGEKIPASQVPMHMRVGLLDNKWLEQRNKEIREKSDQDQVYASGSVIESNLKQLAQRRSDIFGVGAEETAIGKTAEEKEQGSKPEKLIWDGHLSSAEVIAKRAKDYITAEDVRAHFEAEQQKELERAKIGVQLPTQQIPQTTLFMTAPPPQPTAQQMQQAAFLGGMMMPPPAGYPPFIPPPPSMMQVPPVQAPLLPSTSSFEEPEAKKPRTNE
ncbi:unnamed protein product [Rodentolepis nana]|uniref:Splicing factor 3A subunit 1 n=1 Tax=Rodentolepis nana TaxID=102285 RepID=A0A0R3T3N8_RODNA|nr:unnamed protein product [Rodentolepis nana]